MPKGIAPGVKKNHRECTVPIAGSANSNGVFSAAMTVVTAIFKRATQIRLVHRLGNGWIERDIGLQLLRIKFWLADVAMSQINFRAWSRTFQFPPDCVLWFPARWPAQTETLAD